MWRTDLPEGFDGAIVPTPARALRERRLSTLGREGGHNITMTRNKTKMNSASPCWICHRRPVWIFSREVSEHTIINILDSEESTPLGFSFRGTSYFFLSWIVSWISGSNVSIFAKRVQTMYKALEIVFDCRTYLTLELFGDSLNNLKFWFQMVIRCK